MGRHSAAADDDAEDHSDAVAVVGAPVTLGRHSRPDDSADTDELKPVAAPAGGAASGPVTKPGSFGRSTAPPRTGYPRSWRPRDRPVPPAGRAQAAKPSAPSTSTAGPATPSASPDRAGLIEEALGGRPPTAAAENATAQIPVITDPILDQPVPEALTEVIPPVAEPDDGGPARARDESTRTAESEAGVATQAAPQVHPRTERQSEAGAAEADTGSDVRVAPAQIEGAAPEADAASEAATATETRTDAVAAATVAEPATAAKPAGAHATAADLTLLRRHGDVRARCIAGLIVPFVAYVVVLLAIGSFTGRTFLLWLAVPIVVAGVLVGLFLDLGHRRYGRATTDVSGSADRP